MLKISFIELECFFTAVWLLCRIIVWIRQRAQLKSEVPVCKSKFQSSEICKIKCQKGREETEVSITNLAVKFARLETSLANRLK